MNEVFFFSFNLKVLCFENKSSIKEFDNISFKVDKKKQYHLRIKTINKNDKIQNQLQIDLNVYIAFMYSDLAHDELMPIAHTWQYLQMQKKKNCKQ